MRSMRVNMDRWTARNLWLTPGGELAVRPGLRKEYAPSANHRIVGGFSARSGVTGDIWFYIVVEDTTNSLTEQKLLIYDDNWVLLDTVDLGSRETTRDLTFGTIYLFLVVNSPSWMPHRGFVGSSLVPVKPVPSDNNFTNIIAPPRGLCSAWANSRMVYSEGNSIYVSDPVTGDGGDPATVTGGGQVPIDGVIYGLHVGRQGALMACTDKGVWALPEDAAGIGQIPYGSWQKVSDHETIRYGTTVKYDGRLWGLTRKGVQTIDSENGQEIIIGDPMLGLEDYPLFTSDDFRKHAMLYAGGDGPIVALPEQGAWCMMDVEQQFFSWWCDDDTAPDMRIVGALTHSDGTQVLLGEDGAWRVTGNIDDDGEALDTSYTEVHGLLFGRPHVEPEMSTVVRRLDIAADGKDFVAVLRGEKKTAALTQASPIVGTDAWSTANAVDPEVESKRFHFNQRIDDLSLAVGVKGQLTRLSRDLYIEARGPSKKRPQ